MLSAREADSPTTTGGVRISTFLPSHDFGCECTTFLALRWHILHYRDQESLPELYKLDNFPHGTAMHVGEASARVT